MSLEAVTEEPHHDYSSFRVRGKIFVTVPPAEDVVHVFVGEEERELALALYPQFMEKLLWGGKASSKAYETRVRKDAGPRKSKASKGGSKP
jgi:hypothetical protein